VIESSLSFDDDETVGPHVAATDGSYLVRVWLAPQGKARCPSPHNVHLAHSRSAGRASRVLAAVR